MLARVEDGIGWMTYNNPERLNAMSVEMTLAVPRILTAFRDDPDVRVIVVTGAGTRAFVSGADISEFGERRTSVDARAEYDTAMADAWRVWRELDKPVLAMIRGYCIGGGLLAAMRADIRIAAEGQPVRGAGGAPRARVRVRWRRGARRARRPVVGGGDPVLRAAASADEALRIGLVNRVVPADELEAQVRELARAIAANAPLTVAGVQGRDPRGVRRARRSRPSTASTSWSRRASAPRTTSRGKPRSARSASHAFAVADPGHRR